MALPTDAKERKTIPLATGVLDYFPDALIEVAKVSVAGNKQHVPGEPLHWDRSKSTDEADAAARHFLERGKIDRDGLRHTAKLAWRSLAMLQKEIEAAVLSEKAAQTSDSCGCATQLQNDEDLRTYGNPLAPFPGPGEVYDNLTAFPYVQRGSTGE